MFAYIVDALFHLKIAFQYELGKYIHRHVPHGPTTGSLKKSGVIDFYQYPQLKSQSWKQHYTKQQL